MMTFYVFFIWWLALARQQVEKAYLTRGRISREVSFPPVTFSLTIGYFNVFRAVWKLANDDLLCLLYLMTWMHTWREDDQERWGFYPPMLHGNIFDQYVLTISRHKERGKFPIPLFVDHDLLKEYPYSHHRMAPHLYFSGGRGKASLPFPHFYGR